MKTAIIGCGSIGQRHARNLLTLGESDLVVYDPMPGRASEFAASCGIRAADTLEDAMALRPDVVWVCTPPHLHTDVAARAVEARAHIFIEKPIASSLEGIDQLLEKVRSRGVVLYVGYNLRFQAGMAKTKELLGSGVIGRLLMIRAEAGQYLPDWRPTQDYRAGYITRRSTGGGIILDASHEIDYVRWLAGEVESVYCVAAHLSALEMETEDSAAIILRMAGGVIGEIHLDCIQRGYTKNCKLIGDAGTLVWDFKDGIRLLRAGAMEWEQFPMAPDVNDMYIKETRHFLQCVRGEATPLVDGETGRRILAVALAARDSAERRQQVTL